MLQALPYLLHPCSRASPTLVHLTAMDGGNAGDCQEQSLPWTRRTRLAGAVFLVVWLVPLSVTADDGNLTQQLHAQQQQSRFQLMLEQVAKSARQRAAAAQSAPASHAGAATPIDLGDWAESARLQPVAVTDPVSPQFEPESARRVQARQAHDRDQQRNLHQRQQRRALIAGARTGGLLGIDSFGAKRRQLVRYNAQNQRQSLQRKLRR